MSGPGHAVIGDGRGGWRSGSSGVVYSGPYTRPEYQNTTFKQQKSAVAEGLLPPILPAWDVHIRDGVVTLGGDGMYYLTGSSGDNIWAWAQGIELWCSKDLHTWDYLGLVWEIESEAPEWVRRWRQHPRRALGLCGHQRFIMSKAIISSSTACALKVSASSKVPQAVRKALMYEGRYSPCVAVADNIYGPYRMRHEAVPVVAVQDSSPTRRAIGGAACSVTMPSRILERK